MKRRLADERGVGLVEMLVTVVILGTGFIAILAGLTTLMRTTDIHQEQARGETIIREYAEALDDATFVSCATTYAPAYTAPEGWTVRVTAVRYWDRGTRSFGATCTPNSAQLVSLSASEARVTEVLDVVKRPL